jgi:hypothetical protein
MILKHTGNVKAISRVGLPEFQSKDRLELEVLEVEAQADAGLTSLQPTRQSGAYAAALGSSLFSVNFFSSLNHPKNQNFRAGDGTVTEAHLWLFLTGQGTMLRTV